MGILVFLETSYSFPDDFVHLLPFADDGCVAEELREGPMKLGNGSGPSSDP